MPPLLAHDPLEAAQRSVRPGWLLASATALSVACEPWVLALLALALYAWLEGSVPAVLKAFAPFAAALLVGVGLVVLSSRAGRVAGWGVRGIPSGHALWSASFAVYTLRVYGPRWGLVGGALSLSGGLSRICLGSNGIPSVGAGWLVGGLLGLAAFEVAARVAPAGPAGLRRARRRGSVISEAGEDVTP